MHQMLAFLCMVGLTVASPIDKYWLESISQMQRTLEMVPSVKYSYSNSPATLEKLHIIPKILLNSVDMSMMLPHVATDSVNMALDDDELHLQIPQDATNMFLFNTDDASKYNATENFAGLLSNSAPFRIPQSLYLTDIFMVVPGSSAKPKVTNAVHDSTIIRTSLDKYPIFRNSYNLKKPLVVFVLDSYMENNTTPMARIINTNGYLPTSHHNSDVSSFFDTFAKKSVELGNYQKLVHSEFCTSCRGTEGYCLRVSGNSSVQLFPIISQRHLDVNVSVFKTQVMDETYKTEIQWPKFNQSDDHQSKEQTRSFSVSEFPDGYVFPLSIINDNGYTVDSPRNQKYSQLLFEEEVPKDRYPKRKLSPFSTNKDCQPISWYNIFHHSIFGQPKFCHPNKKKIIG